MAALHSVKHFHYVFTTQLVGGSFSKLEAHVFALCREEADLLFHQKAPQVWAMLDVTDNGIARHFMIAGKRFNSNKSYVASIGQYIEPLDSRSATPFTDFVKLYRSTIAELPLLDFKKQLWDHKAHHIPTAEQFEILADETGEYVSRIKERAMREFLAFNVAKAIRQFGRKEIERIIGTPSSLEDAERGVLSDDAIALLKSHIPNFAVIRYYSMTAPELLYFHDMNNGTFSDKEIYSGEKSLLDFPKRVITHLCNIDTRFGALLVKSQGVK